MKLPDGRLAARASLAVSLPCYIAALVLPALCQRTADPYTAVEPWPGYVCFTFGLLYFFFVSPLILWSPNAFIAILWYRSLAGLPTSRRFAVFVPLATAASTIACSTLFPFRSMVGAGLWVASALFAAGATILPIHSRADHP